MIDRILQIPRTVGFYLFLLLFAAGIWVLNLIAFIIRPFTSRRVAREILRISLNALVEFYVTLMEYSTCLKTNRDVLRELRGQGTGSLIIANHPSMVDAPVLLSVIPNLLCVFKSSLKQSLLLPHTAKTLGYLSNDEGMDMLRELAQSLKTGRQFLLFPEGTRTNGKTVNPFNKSYALAALNANIPLHLVCIRTDSPVLSKRQHFLKPAPFPIVYNYDIGPTIEPGDFKTVRELNDVVEGWFRKTLESPQRVVRQFLPARIDVSHEESGIRARFRVPRDPFYCHGHMPDEPLVPGYAQMAWAHELLCGQAGTFQDGIRYIRWKFLQPVFPGDELEVEIAGDGDARRLSIFRSDEPVTRGRLGISSGKEKTV